MLKFVLFAASLVASTIFVLLIIIIVGISDDLLETASVGELSRIGLYLVIPVAVAGVCWSWVGILGGVQRNSTMKVASSGLLVAAVGLVVMGQVDRMRTVDPIDTEAEARPILERLVRRRAEAHPESIRIVDLARQIRNVSITGPTMTFEADWSRRIKFELDTGCDAIVSFSAYVGSEGPIELLGRVEKTCAPEMG